jgi:hypothetical protein
VQSVPRIDHHVPRVTVEAVCPVVVALDIIAIMEHVYFWVTGLRSFKAIFYNR